MKATWLGHSLVKLEGSKTVLIDPFINGNSKCPVKLSELGHIDFVAVTHAHGDHLGDAYTICKMNDATFIGCAELADDAAKHGVKSVGLNIGGSWKCDNVAFNMVNAVHSSPIGCACGYVIYMDGKRVYHAGDTALTMDMKLIGAFFEPDLSFLPIGDKYTMGMLSAIKAVEYTKTKKVIPIHYNTFPGIEAKPDVFKEMVGSRAEVLLVRPGEVYEL